MTVKKRNPVPSKRSGMQSLMQRLEALERETQVHIANTGHSRWMIPYADLITLLLGLFMLLFSISALDNQELTAYATELQNKLATAEVLTDAVRGIGNENLTGYAADIPPEAALQQELSEQLASEAGVNISIEARGVVISLQDDILFDAGSAELSAPARRTLDKLVASLKPLGRPFRVEGHTDNSPIATSRYPSNWELSTARATNILKYLLSRHHFAPELMSAAGYGEFRPVADNSSIGGKQRNRRVDIVILSAESAHAEPRDKPVRMPTDDGFHPGPDAGDAPERGQDTLTRG